MIIAIVTCIALLTSTQHAAGQAAAATSSNTSDSSTESPVVEVLLLKSVEPNGTLNVTYDGSDNLFGDSVKPRESKSIYGDGCITMIDTRNALPAGVLQRFYLFIEQHNSSARASFLSLQIWKRSGVQQYRLLWQRLVYLNDSSPRALYAFDVSADKFVVTQGDYIGWTGHDNNRFISRDNDPSQCQDCTHYRFNGQGFQDSGDTHFCVPTIRERPYKGIKVSPRQFVFSAAVRISRPVVVTSASPAASVISTTPYHPAPAAPATSTTVSRLRSVTSTTTRMHVLGSADHTTAVTIGVIFGILGAFIVAITAVFIWKRHVQIWSALKTKSSAQDTCAVLESGSSTPSGSGSTRYSDDIDSASVTTSSSSEVTSGVTAGVRRDHHGRDHQAGDHHDRDHQGLAMTTSALPSAAVSRPRPHTRGDRSALRPTRSKLERDNDAFVEDDAAVTSAPQNVSEKQQQQQPAAATSKHAPDSQIHCISVELHATPSGTDSANVWSI